MTRTKIDIDGSLVRRLVSAQFPEWAELSIEPVVPGGWDNRTFRLGEDMLVRLPSAESYAAQVQKEQRWLPRLAPYLPVPIPSPLAMGRPAGDYPWSWSVYRWLEGDVASSERIEHPLRFARDLAEFLLALQEIDAIDGPRPGPHNFLRGAPPEVYDAQTRDAISALKRMIDIEAATEVWEAALESEWQRKPVWLHGDMAEGNLLVKNGRLCAVIDFGCSVAGDPACDLAIAWTFFSGPSRDAFREALGLDEATWARGRGWALWKALITIARAPHTSEAQRAANTLDEVLADHRCA